MTNYEKIKNMSVEEMADDKIILEIVSGCEGKSLYINDYRVAGSKPWGGGTVIETFVANKKEVLKALNMA